MELLRVRLEILPLAPPDRAESGSRLGIGAGFSSADPRHGVGQRRERQLPGGRESLAQAAG